MLNKNELNKHIFKIKIIFLFCFFIFSLMLQMYYINEFFSYPIGFLIIFLNNFIGYSFLVISTINLVNYKINGFNFFLKNILLLIFGAYLCSFQILKKENTECLVCSSKEKEVLYIKNKVKFLESWNSYENILSSYSFGTFKKITPTKKVGVIIKVDN